MRKALLTLGAAVAVCVAGATQSASTQPAASRAAAPAAASAVGADITTANVPMPTLTEEEREYLRRARSPERRTRVADLIAAQRTARDVETGEFRALTAAEAQALTPAIPASTPQVFELPGGGVGVRADASHVSFSVATLDASGTVTTGHTSAGTKGGQHER